MFLHIHVAEPSPASAQTAPDKKNPVYEEAFKFTQRSTAAPLPSSSNGTGTQYAEVQHPHKPIPSIFMDPPVHYTALKVHVHCTCVFA